MRGNVAEFDASTYIPGTAMLRNKIAAIIKDGMSQLKDREKFCWTPGFPLWDKGSLSLAQGR